jgi:F-type H+-transporting ATPase subunit delta
MFSFIVKRTYVATSQRMAEAAAAAAPASKLVLNLCTPHAPLHNNKTVNMVMVPGESGEYGITAGHAPLISQLKPGVVTIIHTTVIFN